ncbi:hypothetical protein [Pseudomonas aeruginosa]|uniref:hypothetical protein n=1 Tax=Pseudomonas aeruginosa TaxID=287 RepID=UPI000AA833F0|nr:hypothetical protein [Pseudomonas aeruginosa]
MKGKIVLEEHVSSALNNRLWGSSGEAARHGKAYMASASPLRVGSEADNAYRPDCNVVRIAGVVLALEGVYEHPHFMVFSLFGS